MADLVVYEGKIEESIKPYEASLVEYTSQDAKGYIIEDDAGFKEAGDIVNELKAIVKQLEEVEKSFTAGALETVENIRSVFRPKRQRALEGVKIWTQHIKDYLNAKQLQQQEIHNALQAAVAAQDPKEVKKQLTKLEEKPTADSVSVAKIWKWRVINRDIVPTQFTVVDERLVNAEMRRQLAEGPAKPYVSGIEFYQENSIRSRG